MPDGAPQRSGSLRRYKSKAAAPLPALKGDLDSLKVDKELQAAFWDMAKNNINSRTDIEKWWKICSEGATLGQSNRDIEFLSEAFKILPMPPFDETTWSTWTKKVGEKTGRSGKNLYMPLRNALTGLDHGPDMSKLMPLLMKVKRP